MDTPTPSFTGYLEGNARGGMFPFAVEPFSEDYTGRLSWHFLGNHLLRCASLHAGRYGFGYDDMILSRHVWVLSRLVIDLKDMPRTGEHYNIETWVSRVYRQFTDRLFAITSPEGKSYGYAISTWALIDLDSRQPIDLAGMKEEKFSRNTIEKEVPIPGPGRLRLANPVKVASREAVYTDLDINGHVNSIRYIEMMLDLFPHHDFRANPPVRLEVAYSAEAYRGDTLDFYKEEKVPGHYLVEIRKGDDVPVVKASIRFATETAAGTAPC